MRRPCSSTMRERSLGSRLGFHGAGSATMSTRPLAVTVAGRRAPPSQRVRRGRAPCAIAIANPDQNRHLMTVAAHLASQPRSLSLPAARRSTRALTSSRPRSASTAASTPNPHMLPTEEARLRRWPRHDCAPSGCAPTHAICWRPRNPHSPRPTKQRPSSPRFPPCEAFEPRPPAARPTVVQGAGVRNPRMRAWKSTANCWSR